jgi:hypothetical protein
MTKVSEGDMKLDVLLSVRQKDLLKGIENTYSNVARANIPMNKLLFDTSYPVSYSRWKLLQQSSTDWVVCLDDDVVIEENWFRYLLHFMMPDVVAIEGLIGYSGKPRLLRKGERSYGFWNLIIRTDVAKKWHPSKWVRSWEDYQIGQHCLKYGKCVRVPVKGQHNRQLDVKQSGLWSGRGCRDALGIGSLAYLCKLSFGMGNFLIKRDRYGTIQNTYAIKGLLSR